MGGFLCGILQVNFREGVHWEVGSRTAGGVVTRSYFVNLRNGRIENPGLDKLAAIAKTKGFAPALWFEEGSSSEATSGASRRKGHKPVFWEVTGSQQEGRSFNARPLPFSLPLFT